MGPWAGPGGAALRACDAVRPHEWDALRWAASAEPPAELVVAGPGAGQRVTALCEAARHSAASRGVLACAADCAVPLLQTPMKKTNALIAQMGVTFLNAVSVCLNALRLRGASV